MSQKPLAQQRAWDDPSARSCRWHCDPRRSSRVSRNWHDGVSQKRQRTHERGRYGGPCLYTHAATVFAQLAGYPQPLIQVQSQNELHHGCGLTLKRLIKLTSR
jgi:hypothetical protein